MGANICVMMAFSPYLRSAMVRFPLPKLPKSAQKCPKFSESAQQCPNVPKGIKTHKVPKNTLKVTQKYQK